MVRRQARSVRSGCSRGSKSGLCVTGPVSPIGSVSRAAVTPTATGSAILEPGSSRASRRGALDGGPGKPGEQGYGEAEQQQEDRGGAAQGGLDCQGERFQGHPAAIRASAVRTQARKVRSLARLNRGSGSVPPL